MLDLEPIFAPFRPVLGYYNNWLTTIPPAENETVKIVPVAAYLDQNYLREVISKRAAQLGTTDLKAAASDWQLYYNRAVLPLVLLGLSLGGIGLEADINSVSLILEETIPHSIILPDLASLTVYPERCQNPKLASDSDSDLLIHVGREVATVAELQQVVFSALFQGHFSPLFEVLQAITAIPKTILWGNLAYSCLSLYRFLADKLANPTAVGQDRLALLERSTNPAIASSRNPLYQPVYQLPLNSPGLPEVVEVRRSCCLFYRLPGYSKCTNCPRLKLPERVARWQAQNTKGQ